MNDYYDSYKKLRDLHNDHLQAIAIVLVMVVKDNPEMTICEFYEMKKVFMDRYFKENYEKYNIENL